MQCYSLLRPFVFTMPPEKAHRAAILALRSGLMPARPSPTLARLRQTLWGLDFPTPVGLAAGFDKDAEAVDGLLAQAFGFVECGTVTPKPQAGNPQPRLFRLPAQEAVINRLGFNNGGLEVFTSHLRGRRAPGIVGGNIGKNKDSTDAIADYVTCLHAVYPLVDYITVNISSPNTPGLRDLQAEDALRALVRALHAARSQYVTVGVPPKPLWVKIAPDLDSEAVAMIAELALAERVDALVVSNTTLSRPWVDSPEAGGLSGAPLMALSTQVLAQVARATGGKVPLIGVGGIRNAEDAYQKILHGASLVQLYTALIYQGLGLPAQIAMGLDALLARDGFSHVSEAIGKAL